MTAPTMAPANIPNQLILALTLAAEELVEFEAALVAEPVGEAFCVVMLGEGELVNGEAVAGPPAEAGVVGPAKGAVD